MPFLLPGTDTLISAIENSMQLKNMITADQEAEVELNIFNPVQHAERQGDNNGQAQLFV
jgi:hypothetical protein